MARKKFTYNIPITGHVGVVVYANDKNEAAIKLQDGIYDINNDSEWELDFPRTFQDFYEDDVNEYLANEENED